ncbi:SDR family oxidoreductase [Mycobacterium sp. CVI_P3]|uniref:SDR family oxidoreductase n=1 Tax=Mycobacterium pinniadriaticum TaxID=2994102 RepID=A0ABT3SDS3_9MYCO|nr:SDR family oxidoreductase [Mycobacterium pinniadriaticum]MCX2930845.1 SDR family oxidoreductase [Mycobacterium pinniadriaticum]MCX2937269.1 SDR family oxidoreductase [Mycobacterium pinniadriaticum]
MTVLDAHTPVSDAAPTPAQLFDLTGRTALVTGASSGLGVQFALTLRAAGANVVVAARRSDRLAGLCESHPGLTAVTCDVSDPSSVESAHREVEGSVGNVDILVNNAGLSIPARAEEESLDDFRYVLDVNLVGAFRLTQLVGRQMIANGGGSIVNVASILGLVASAPNRQAAYCASKGALINMTRELAVQWARYGIRVNALAPGFFPSEATADLLEDEAGASYVRRNTPMNRTGRAGELSGALLLLASDAGSYLTGQVLAVDGGWTAR